MPGDRGWEGSAGRGRTRGLATPLPPRGTARNRHGGSVHHRAGTEQQHHHHHHHITQNHGRQSPQAEHGREGAAAAQPESRGVERGGRQRCHLQRVPLQGLQPGLWLHDQSGSTGRKTGSPPRVVQCVQQGSHHPEHPRLRGFVGAGHQPGQLHRAGGSFPLLTRDPSDQPTPPCATVPCTQSLFPPPRQILDPESLRWILDPESLTPCQPPQRSSDGWRHCSGCVYPSLISQVPSLNPSTAM